MEEFFGGVGQLYAQRVELVKPDSGIPFCSFQLSTILELLEGSFYGMDLLKLHSVTNKLLDRMERIEKV